jgi:hypothetical protein
MVIVKAGARLPEHVRLRENPTGDRYRYWLSPAVLVTSSSKEPDFRWSGNRRYRIRAAHFDHAQQHPGLWLRRLSLGVAAGVLTLDAIRRPGVQLWHAKHQDETASTRLRTEWTRPSEPMRSRCQGNDLSALHFLLWDPIRSRRRRRQRDETQEVRGPGRTREYRLDWHFHPRISRSRRARLLCSPHRYSNRVPSGYPTRWHGMATAITLRVHSSTTYRAESPLAPTIFAISSGLTILPAGVARIAARASCSKSPPFVSSGNSNFAAGRSMSWPTLCTTWSSSHPPACQRAPGNSRANSRRRSSSLSPKRMAQMPLPLLATRNMPS